MDINATLFAEMFWFLLFVLFTMKYVWPPLQKNLQARKEQIADGLAAAEKGQRELELAQHKKRQELEAAKLQAAQIIEQARIRGSEMVDQSRVQARKESEHLLEAAQTEIERSYKKARMELQQEVSTLAIAVAEKLLKHHLDAANNQALIDGFIEQLSAKGASANG